GICDGDTHAVSVRLQLARESSWVSTPAGDIPPCRARGAFAFPQQHGIAAGRNRGRAVGGLRRIGFNRVGGRRFVRVGVCPFGGPPCADLALERRRMDAYALPRPVARCLPARGDLRAWPCRMGGG